MKHPENQILSSEALRATEESAKARLPLQNDLSTVPAVTGCSAGRVRNAQTARPGGNIRPGGLSSSTGKALGQPAALSGNSLLPTGRKRTRSTYVRTFEFQLPRRAQLALIDLPEVRRLLVAREKAMRLGVAERLIRSGFSLNKASRLLGISPSELFAWRQAYQKEGLEGLISKRDRCGAKRTKGGQRKPTPCKLSFFIQG